MRKMDNKYNKEPLSDKIREARVANGFTIVELAERIGVSKQLISSYELGQKKPSLEVFNRLVLALGFPMDFYIKDDKLSIMNESPIYYRSLKSADRKNRDICTIRFKWMNKLITYINRYINYPEVNLPEFEDELIKDEYTLEDIEKITMQLREYWGINEKPIDNLVYLLEKNGFVFTQIKINDAKIDAFSRWIGNRPVIFLGSDKECCVRARFNAAHELSHTILHKHIHEDILKDPKQLKRIEKEANMFASAFLLPREQFGEEVISTTLDYFIILKRRWKVSIQGMIYRCNELGYLSEDQTLYLRKKMAKLKMRTKEPLDDELEIEEPLILKQAIRLLVSEKIITKSELRQLLYIPTNVLEELLNLDKGELEQVMNSTMLNVSHLRSIQ